MSEQEAQFAASTIGNPGRRSHATRCIMGVQFSVSQFAFAIFESNLLGPTHCSRSSYIKCTMSV